MHHRTAVHGDVDGALGPAVHSDHRVLHGVAAFHAVRNGMQLTGFRVPLGVRAVAAGQRPAEVPHPDGVQLVGELVLGDAALDEGQRTAGVADHVGVGAQPGDLELALGLRLPQRSAGLRAAHVAVAVPLGLAVAQPQAVHHAVAGEPVVALGIDRADRVGAVAQVAPVQVVRDLADDVEIGEGVFPGQRGEGALEVAVRHRPILPITVLLVICITPLWQDGKGEYASGRPGRRGRRLVDA